MRFLVEAFSDAGPRSENQDSIAFKSFRGTGLIIAVADGLGGHFGGKVASELAVKYFIEQVASGKSDLRTIAECIHGEIRSLQDKSVENRSMATTLSAAVLDDGLMQFVHCGDCRIVASRNAGIRKLTNDHTEAQRLFSSGAITKSELMDYPRKNILESALGAKVDPQIDTGNFVLLPGDKIFFTTDGVHNKIALRELFQLTSGIRNPVDIVGKVKAEIVARQPDDNFTFAAVLVA